MSAEEKKPPGELAVLYSTIKRIRKVSVSALKTIASTSTPSAISNKNISGSPPTCPPSSPAVPSKLRRRKSLDDSVYRPGIKQVLSKLGQSLNETCEDKCDGDKSYDYEDDELDTDTDDDTISVYDNIRGSCHCHTDGIPTEFDEEDEEFVRVSECETDSNPDVMWEKFYDLMNQEFENHADDDFSSEG